MSDLQVKANIENGDLPEDFDGKKTKLEPITLGDCKIEFKDIMNPTKLREWFEKVDGQENKDKKKIDIDLLFLYKWDIKERKICIL